MTVATATRLVVSLLRDGVGIDEALTPSIAEQLAFELRITHPRIILRPLIATVGAEALSELRQRARIVSGDEVASAGFRFGGLFSIEGRIEDLRFVADMLSRSILRLPEGLSVEYWRLEAGLIDRKSETRAPSASAGSVATGAMWRPLDNDGHGDPTLRWVNVELGWVLPHIAIQHASLGFMSGGSPQQALCEEWSHGLSSLGLGIGEEIGVAPGVAAPYLISAFGRIAPQGFDVADAIFHAGSLMEPGDVMLIEQQYPWPLLPIEYVLDVWRAIRLVSDNGIVVVEPAGNARAKLGPSSFGDSGAIIVGAAPVTVGNNCEFVDSNWGPRIDVWGPGSCLLTAAVDCNKAIPVGANSHMTRSFGNTSAAAAIVSGVCVCLQALRALAVKGRLLPSDMRNLLRRSLTDANLRLNSRVLSADAIGREALRL